MAILSLVAFAAAARVQGPQPLLWLNTRGQLLIEGRPAEVRSKGVAAFKTPNGIAFNFTDRRGGVRIPDLPHLALTGSITVSLWVYARGYGIDSSGAQILFRGDDRNGLDPFFLRIEHDDTMTFTVEDGDGRPSSVKGELALGRWTHVTASYNVAVGEMWMYLDGRPVAWTKTSVHPFDRLDTRFAPGLGIGNVQNDSGPHNQPFDGMMADLRLYDAVLPPAEAGYLSAKQNQP